ncbi:hypothetical protein MPSI1_001095 [Malassezia psittaci]|uniref:Uncharacterized protein n=1 Tax=Malassezia psittaci TaxID=1821823 RepID=A0AAF0JDJ3_9BASI|nr:hypothetical protein MPSI1_001095 [Malassezia psittaci]
MALATSIVSILTVNYFRTHKPIIYPSWGSLIFMVVMGFLTCLIYFGYYVFLPASNIFKRGSFMSFLFLVKTELLFQFGMCSIWISGSIAYASDFRGHDNCLFDGYYHYTKPSDWNHVCNLINYIVPLAYATFGVQAAFMAVEGLFAMYLFLFVDQDSINEPFWEWGQRAWNYQHQNRSALSSFNEPMKYRPGVRNQNNNTGSRFFGNRQSKNDMYEDYNEKRYYDEGSGRTGLRSGMTVNGPYSSSEQDGFSDYSSQYGSSTTHSRRGVEYSDPSSASSISDATTVASPSPYHGGAYSRHSTNSRRAGLSEAPKPAGAGGTSSLRAPAWSPPSITSDGDTLNGSDQHTTRSMRRDQSQQMRRVSTPASLGSRGRRGVAYGASEDGNDDTADYGTAFDPSDRLYRSPSNQTPRADRRNRARLANAQRRRVSLGDETGWHLRED